VADNGGADVFVSYTAADQAWAEWITEKLEHAGLRVSMQAWDVPAGENFVKWIGEQLRCAQRTLAVYSSSYFDSFWCTEEWTSALAGRSLLPVRVEDVSPPPPLNTHNYVDVFCVSEAVAQQRLFEAVGLLSVARKAIAGFPALPVQRESLFSGESISGATTREQDAWLNDLQELDRAKETIDDDIRKEFQRKILSTRFQYSHYQSDATQGGPGE
jgi:hypothetical protein